MTTGCPGRGERSCPPGDVGMGGNPLSVGDARRLVAAYLDDCTPCVVQARSTTHISSGVTSVAALVTAWLSEAAARWEATGNALPDTAAGVVVRRQLCMPTRLPVGLVPLAGPERPGGSVRVTQQEVTRALGDLGPRHGGRLAPDLR